MYKPPRDILENYRSFIDELTPEISKRSQTNSEIIIAADTNINLLKLNEHEIYGEIFDALTRNNFYPNITLPTKFSNTKGTLIDTLFAN